MQGDRDLGVLIVIIANTISKDVDIVHIILFSATFTCSLSFVNV